MRYIDAWWFWRFDDQMSISIFVEWIPLKIPLWFEWDSCPLIGPWRQFQMSIVNISLCHHAFRYHAMARRYRVLGIIEQVHTATKIVSHSHLPSVFLNQGSASFLHKPIITERLFHVLFWPLCATLLWWNHYPCHIKSLQTSILGKSDENYLLVLYFYSASGYAESAFSAFFM